MVQDSLQSVRFEGKSANSFKEKPLDFQDVKRREEVVKLVVGEYLTIRPVARMSYWPVALEGEESNVLVSPN